MSLGFYSSRHDQARAIRLGDTVHLRTPSGKYLEVVGDDLHARSLCWFGADETTS